MASVILGIRGTEINKIQIWLWRTFCAMERMEYFDHSGTSEACPQCNLPNNFCPSRMPFGYICVSLED